MLQWWAEAIKSRRRRAGREKAEREKEREKAPESVRETGFGPE
jgi:hypothetical protein